MLLVSVEASHPHFCFMRCFSVDNEEKYISCGLWGVEFRLLWPFLKFIYFWQRGRERQSMSRGGAERGRHRVWSKLQALSRQHRARCGARTLRLRDHDLSRGRTLNRLSHPGAPAMTIFKEDVVSSVWPWRLHRALVNIDSRYGHVSNMDWCMPACVTPGFHQDSDLLDQRKHCFTVQSESGEDLYFSVELDSDLAQWERAFQTATFLEVERIQVRAWEILGPATPNNEWLLP